MSEPNLDESQVAWLKRMSEVLDAKFDDFDADDDGYLSDSEIDSAMGDGSLHGEEAIAVATLDQQQDNIEELSNDEWGDENDGVTRADLAVMGRGEGDNIDDIHGTARHMQGRNVRAQQVPDEVVSGEVDPLAVEQGMAGSCSFLASAAGLAAQDADAIEEMIDENDDGTYTVNFPDGRTETVSRPTEAEMTRFANAGSNGLWIAILEKAYGGGDQEEATGHQDSAIETLTGDSTNTDDTTFTGQGTLRERLISAMASNKVVVASNNQVQDVDEGIVDDHHAYTVLDFNENTDRIQLRNPWGNTEPSGNGSNDGVFELSLDEFESNFHDITFQE